MFHEVWAPSRFVVDALKRMPLRHAPTIRLAPHPRPDVADVEPDRARYGLADDVFAFLAMYDVHSSASRKNPMGAIAAFQEAFDPAHADVVLLVKVVAAAESRTCMDELTAQIAGWPNIRLVTDMLSDDEANRLIRSADAFVSLHRSEGFGLSIAQAMAMGRPVIVTGWSGNMDFCQQGATLVRYALVPVSDPHGVYSDFEGPEQVWAEPDLSDAARAMRRFAADPAAARAEGEVARRHIMHILPPAYDISSIRNWIA
jgi:glycosyltransferase involved in cell wall biosynthesis